MRSSELAYAMFFVILFVFIGAVVLNRDGNRVEMGDLTRQTRQLSAFNRLHLDGVFEVYLKQGNAASVEIEAREGIMDRIITETDGNSLKVTLKKGTQLRNTNIKVYITVRDLEKITVNGVTSVRTEAPLHLSNLELEQHSVGNTQLSLQCDRLTARVTGVGALTLDGSGTQVALHNTGVGAINAAGFEADVLQIDNTGVGGASVNARREISIRATGVGSVRYKGLATVKELRRTGVGSVERI